MFAMLILRTSGSFVFFNVIAKLSYLSSFYSILIILFYP